MDFKKMIWCLCAFICFRQNKAFSQRTATPLKIGDKCPDISLSNMVNYPTANTTLFKLKGKMILLDFGLTTCGPCMHLLPKLDSLQKQFSGKLQVFMVTTEAREKILKFLQNNIVGKRTTISIITGNTRLSDYFRHTGIPHEVWIDANGIVRAFTDEEYVTAANIYRIIKGEKVTWPMKLDLNYDYSKPVLIANDDNIKPISMPQKIFYSAFTTHLNGIVIRGNGEQFDSAKNVYIKRLVNFPLIAMYADALDLNWYFFPKSHLLLDLRDTSAVMYLNNHGITNAEWAQTNTYCYEYTLPARLQKAERSIRFLNDLDAFSGLHGRMEKRWADCWVLEEKDSLKAGTVKDMHIASFIDTTSANEQFIVLSTLLSQLNSLPGHPPVINETRYTTEELGEKCISIRISSLFDIANVSRGLRQSGCTMKQDKRLMDFFVLSDK